MALPFDELRLLWRRWLPDVILGKGKQFPWMNIGSSRSFQFDIRERRERSTRAKGWAKQQDAQVANGGSMHFGFQRRSEVDENDVSSPGKPPAQCGVIGELVLGRCTQMDAVMPSLTHTGRP